MKRCIPSAVGNMSTPVIDVRLPSVFLTVSLFLVVCSFAGCNDSQEETQSSSATPVTTTLQKPPLERRQSIESAPPGTLPQFTILGAESGLDFQRFDDISGQRRILETNGGGVAVFDFDRDGRLDLFFTNGCRLPISAEDQQTPSALFRNLGEMKFDKVSGQAGLMQFGFATGCTVGDYNSDGFDDLYVTAFGRNSMWLNNGDGTFEDRTIETGTQVPRWSTSAAFADLDGDGVLDLYVVNYLDESDTNPRLCPNPASPDGFAGCSPSLFDGVDDVLFRGDGEGGFTDLTRDSGIEGHPGKGLGVVISDLNFDGRLEIYVANDGEANSLYALKEVPSADSDRLTLNYEDLALAGGLALNERGYAQASMGIAAGDVDADGRIDLFLTHFYGDTNTLYLNTGDLIFLDATRGSGLGASSRQVLGFGTVLFDFDNDGWLDLFVANGHVDDRTWMPGGQPYRMPPQIYRNERNGKLLEVSQQSGDYFQQSWLGRGVACGDLDRDGRVDLAVSHQLAPSVVLRNETDASQNPVCLRLSGINSNRNGFGTRVDIIDHEPVVLRELSGGRSFQSAHAPEVQLGIGDREAVTIRITWPSGVVDTHENVAPGDWTAVEGRKLYPVPSIR